MHVVATFASRIQSLNSNLDVATGNSHLGVRGTKEPAAQQRQRGVGFCLWGLGEKKVPNMDDSTTKSGFLISVHMYMLIQVVPGRAGGGSFKRKKNYIYSKERICL